MKLFSILRVAATTSAICTSPGNAEVAGYDDLVARFGSAGENFILDKLTHEHWIIDFPEPCVIRRRTTTYVSRDGELAVLANVIEGANVVDLTEESFVQGEGASGQQFVATCTGSRKCVSGIMAESVKDENGLSGFPTVQKKSIDHMTLRLGLGEYKDRLDLLKQIASICRSRPSP